MLGVTLKMDEIRRSYPKANAPLETGEVWLEINNLIAVLDKPVTLDEAGVYKPFKILMKAIEQDCLNRAIIKDTAELIWERPQSSPTTARKE